MCVCVSWGGGSFAKHLLNFCPREGRLAKEKLRPKSAIDRVYCVDNYNYIIATEAADTSREQQSALYVRINSN